MSVTGISREQLKSYMERLERLEEEKAALMETIREVFIDAKENGFDTKTMKQVLRIRKMDQEARLEQKELLDLYLNALGMVSENASAA